MNEYKKKVIKNRILLLVGSAIAGGVFTFFLLKGNEGFSIRILMGMSMGLYISGGFVLFDRLTSKALNKKSLPVKLFISTVSRTAIISLGYWLLLFVFFFSGIFIPDDEEGGLMSMFSDPLVMTYFGPTLLFSFLATFFFETVSIISHLLGQSTLVRLLSGRYNKPFEEERIFMFLDLKGSTSIAESCGNRAFHSFINDFFFTITPAIVESKGEVYKYIGDEVIVSWAMKTGLKNGNFLRSFFLIDEAVNRERESFLKDYGTIPEFRAGIHTGKVVVGEMGDFRKEIAYLGDVVNTAARIIGEAADRKKSLVISSEARNLLSEEVASLYDFSALGKIALRGKSNETELIEVQKKPGV